MDYYDKYQKYRLKYSNLKKHFMPNMQFAVNQLLNSDDKSFVIVNNPINDEETKAIDSLFTKKNIQSIIFDYAGKFDEFRLKNLIDEFIQQIALEKDSIKVTEILIRTIRDYVDTTKKNYVWFTIRLSFPNKGFDIPRWHTDGYYYNVDDYRENNLSQIKLAGVLIGPGTLFKVDNSKMRNKYWELHRSLYTNFNPTDFDSDKDLENRKIIDDVIQKYPSIYPNNNQVAIFVVGQMSRSAIHSEPPIHSKRLFYSIVTGTRDEIMHLTNERNMPFNE